MNSLQSLIQVQQYNTNRLYALIELLRVFATKREYINENLTITSAVYKDHALKLRMDVKQKFYISFPNWIIKKIYME